MCSITKNHQIFNLVHNSTLVNFFYFARLTENIYQTAKVAKILLMLNSGNASQIKGKSLADIEVSADVIEEENKSAQKRKHVEPETNAEDNQISAPNIVNIEESVERITEPVVAGPSTEKQIHEVKMNVSNIKASSGRLRWTNEQKKVVLQFFKTHVKNRTAPKKNECLEIIRQHPNLFTENDWVRIKTLVYNTYRGA